MSDYRNPEDHAFIREQALRDEARPEPARCEACESELDGGAHCILGKAYCVDCTLDEATRLYQEEWRELTVADQLDILEELSWCAGEVRGRLVASLSRGKRRPA